GPGPCRRERTLAIEMVGLVRLPNLFLAALLIACGGGDPPATTRATTSVSSAGGGGTGGEGGAMVGGSGGAGAGCVDSLPAEPPRTALLSETGLYTDVAQKQLAPWVQPFSPRFALWSDTADKERWVYLPECALIDSSDM